MTEQNKNTSTPKTTVAVIGVGYLGKFHAEKYASLPDCELVAVVDSHKTALDAVANKLGVRACDNYRDLLGKVDAVSIVTPTQWHYEIAKEFLAHGTHVLVEKPITVTVEEADELIALAKEHDCVLQVGHLERFNAAVLGLDKVLTKPTFIESHRLAPFKPRATDVNVVLDLMIHDIDIILNLVQDELVDITANGAKVLSDLTDIANARLTFANGCVANVTASRVSLKTERKMRIFQDNAYVSVDFQNRVLSHHYKSDIDAATNTPKIESEETIFEDGDALMTEISHFIDCVRNNKTPLVTGEAGKRALETATRITTLLNQTK